ncbi:MAG: SLC13 family permease, partial [Candidatus Binatia bacterium]
MTRPSARRAAAVFAALATAAALIAFLSPAPARAGDQAPSRVVVGQINDSQGQPIEGAEITALTGPDHEPIAGADSQPDGGFILVLSPILFDSLTLRVERAHFEPVDIQLQRGELESLRAEGTITLAPTTLQRKIEASFWIATGIFAAMLVVIALGRLHNTLASLVAMALVFLTSYLGPAIHEGLFIFSFERSLHFVDWNVIFLIMGMMIVIAVVEHTGIFQWLAFKSYQLSRGKSWLLLVILMTFTGVA